MLFWVFVDCVGMWFRFLVWFFIMFFVLGVCVCWVVF